MTRRLAGDHEGAARHARAMCELGERHGFMPWSLAGAIQGGLSDLHAGELGALDPLLSSVATWRHVLVAEVWTPYWLTELAAAQRAVGRPGEALDALDEALAVAAATGSDFFTAEALRLRGELRAQRGEPGAVEDLVAAVAKARAQEAPAFELRAAVALARVTSGSPQAHEALDTAIGRFARDAHDDELDQARTLAAL
jgi:adenylate cyclase